MSLTKFSVFFCLLASVKPPQDTSALLWRAHDMLYARMDANSGRRGVFKSSAAPLLPPRRDFAPPPVLCPEPPPHHLPRMAIEVCVCVCVCLLCVMEKEGVMNMLIFFSTLS